MRFVVMLAKLLDAALTIIRAKVYSATTVDQQCAAADSSDHLRSYLELLFEPDADRLAH